MQDFSALPRTFFHRTNRLAARLGVQVDQLPGIMDLGRRTLFECRSADSAVSSKSWAKLDEAESKADAAERRQVENAESYANPKESSIGESPQVVREDSPIYGAKNTDEGRRDVFSREEEIVLAFRQIRAGLDLLENIMMKGPKK